MTSFVSIYHSNDKRKRTATVFLIVVETGAGSDTFGASTSARSLAIGEQDSCAPPNLLTKEFGYSVREGFYESSSTQNGSVQFDYLRLVSWIDLTRCISSLGKVGRQDLVRESMLYRQRAQKVGLTLKTSTIGLCEHRKKPLKVLENQQGVTQLVSGYSRRRDLSNLLVWVSETLGHHIKRFRFTAFRQ
jgi:hypothetical protein